MKVTLKNLSEFDRDNVKEATTFIEAIEMTEMKTSFEDVPLPPELKEITDINNISFGHFVVIEKILGFEISDEKKLRMVAPYLIRPSIESKLDNDDAEREEIHKELVETLGIGTIYGVFNRFMPIRKEYLFKTYNGVIYATYTEEDEDDDDEYEGTDDDGSQSAREFHNKKFFWFNLIGAVCGDDIFKRGDAVELMMYEVMPFLAEKRSSNIVETLEMKARRL